MTTFERKTATRLLTNASNTAIAEKLEEGIYQHSQMDLDRDTSEVYKGRFRVIYHNLLNPIYENGQRLIKEIESGQIDPIEMARDWNHRQLFDRIYSEYEEEIRQDERNKALRLQDWVAGITSTASCNKCKREGKPSNRIMITQAQLRSADEPSRSFFYCVECGNRWSCSN